MEDYAIEMIGISKAFPGILANDKVNLSVRKNEVHALLGENGAGKSTLMSILFGSYSADEGTIKINGREEKIKDPNAATALKIGMVHQHFKLVHNYTVTENIVLGQEPRNRFGFLDLRDARKRVQKLSEQYGLQVDPDAKIEDVTVGQEQRVEILKTLYRDADIIILDEPTAVLTPQEIDELMDIIKLLKSEGKTVVLITHKLKEIKAVADRCTVLRRGKSIDTVDVAGVTEKDLAEMMVGRAVNFSTEKKPAQPGEVVLSLKDLVIEDALGAVRVNNLSLDVKAGEIMGIAGVDGNGQSELVHAFNGMYPLTSGAIVLDGEDITRAGVRRRIQQGVGYVPEDRHKYGIVKDFSLSENVILKTYYQEPFSGRFGYMDTKPMDELTDKLIEEFDVRAGKGHATEAGSLSGGNQQKLIIAREINLSPKVLVIAQPTRGLDVGAIEYIHKRIIAERDAGKAVLVVSYDLDEIMNLCDRIATISKGQILDVSDVKDVNEHEIGLMMAGEKKSKAGSDE
ncbi:MAG: ABC transporter ATP-binding protein [Spirochaetales bacterium]|nr:ABC transporter ATP-binding protein [Spirochaetales bacterium]